MSAACMFYRMRLHSDVKADLLSFTQIELGGGDTHGPIMGMKIFRNLTPRLYV